MQKNKHYTHNIRKYNKGTKYNKIKHNISKYNKEYRKYIYNIHSIYTETNKI